LEETMMHGTPTPADHDRDADTALLVAAFGPDIEACIEATILQARREIVDEWKAAMSCSPVCGPSLRPLIDLRRS